MTLGNALLLMVGSPFTEVDSVGLGIRFLLQSPQFIKGQFPRPYQQKSA